MIDAALLTTATAESVHFAEVSELDAVREELLRATNVFETGEEVHDQESLFRVLADTLRFPDWFGDNWDALADCLREVDAPGSRHGFIVVLHHAKALWREAPECAGMLIETWLSIAEERRAEGEPFHLVFLW